MTIFVEIIGAVYTVALVFVIALFARTLVREHATPLEQPVHPQLIGIEQPAQTELHTATETA